MKKYLRSRIGNALRRFKTFRLLMKYCNFRRCAHAHLRKMNRLIPEVPLMAMPYTREELAVLDRQILDKIHHLQFETPAEDSKFLVCGPAIGSGGGSALLGALTKGLKLAYLYNRTMLYDDRYLFYDFCFKATGIHSLSEVIKPEAENYVHFNFLEQKERIVNFQPWDSMEWAVEVEADLLIKYGVRPSTINIQPYEINYAAPLEHLPRNSLYMDGLLINSFLELKEEYKTHIEDRRRAIGFKKPVIGLHIRQGDVTEGNNPLLHYRSYSLKNYFSAIERVASETGIRHVFVTSDSEEAILQLPKDAGLDFIHDDREKRYNNLNVAMLKEKPELRRQETMTMIKSVYLLSECNYIVGAYGHFFRYALALFYHRNKKLNGILIRKQNGAEFDLEYLVTDDTRLPTSTSPVSPYRPPLRERGNIPWLH